MNYLILIKQVVLTFSYLIGDTFYLIFKSVSPPFHRHNDIKIDNRPIGNRRQLLRLITTAHGNCLKAFRKTHKNQFNSSRDEREKKETKIHLFLTFLGRDDYCTHLSFRHKWFHSEAQSDTVSNHFLSIPIDIWRFLHRVLFPPCWNTA